MEIKQKILKELEKKEFPNMKFLFSDEVLDISLKLLEELLDVDKKRFNDLLKTEEKNINFSIFDYESNLDLFWSLLNHLSNVNSWDKIRKIIDTFEPKLIDFSNEVSYSKAYFEMLEYCLNNCELDIDQTKIISDSVKAYKVRWIALDTDKQNELKKINKKLSELSTRFSNNVLDSEKEFKYFLDTDEYLKEFPKSDLDNAKLKAREKWKDWYLFDSSASSYISIIKYCSDSDTRKYFAEVHGSFASKWKYDNREIVLKILDLRNKKAQILDYKNYAELSLEFKMAENPEQVIDLLTDLTIKAKPKALLEIDEIKEYFSLTEINSRDMPYYSRILKEKKYRLDDKKLKEYFEFTSIQRWLFETVEKLYDIKMKKLDNNDLSEDWNDIKYNENIEIYEVYKWDKFISYFMWDYFYNPNKRSWAWADEVRERFWDKKSIVINNMSFVKAENWKTLLTLWEVETMFHEFGHGIHSMLSKSKYADLTWVQVEWDFVELPSQLLENWSNNPETIINIASHYETWEKIPWELVDSLEKLKYFWTWNFVLGQSIYSIMDMYFHSGVVFKDVSELDKIFLEKVNELSIFKKDENYKMYCSFSHIFDWGYSAGYYSYTWADIIVSEILAVFKESWMYDKETATRFEKLILWAWSVKKASDMFKDFMWREISIEAFLKEKWL